MNSGLDAPTSVDRTLLRAAEAEKQALVQDLTALVNIDSGTDDPGLARVSDLLAGRLKDLGASVETMPAPPSAGQTVRGTFKGTGAAAIMMMIHFDTVFGAGEAERRPFKIDTNKALGPGVADAKGGVALILHALAIARQRGANGYSTLTVLFNPDEEKGSAGSRDTINELAAQQDYVLSYEPPDAEGVIVATNGIAQVKLDVTGRSSHAGSAPEKGRNAALELAGQILQLRELGDVAKGTTVNWTVIKAGDRVNIIPDKASAIADMRFSDTQEIARVQRDADNLIQTHVVPDTEVRVTVEGRRPPLPRNPGSDHLGALAASIYRELGRQLEPVAMRFGTDAGFAYRAPGTKPAVLEGLGIVGAGLHSPDEWADLDSIVPRLYLTVRLLERLSDRP